MDVLRPARRVRHLRRYREIVQILAKHGFWMIIEQLGLTHLVAWPMRLRRKPPPPTYTLAERFRLALEELGPTFIKLGQILSTRPDLIPPEFIAELNKLQDRVPPLPWDIMRPVVEEALGRPVESVFRHIDPEPIGSASLGQVYAAELPDGSEVVVKVQRPGIRHTIEVDLEILQDLAAIAQERTSLGEVYNLVEIAEDFAFTLRNELNYVREGRNADRFRENMAELPFVYVPRVYWEFTSERVLVLERIRGIKIDDVEAIRAAGMDPGRIILHAADMIVKQALIDGFFHADPHPGNFYVLPGHTIAMVDFGLVGYLSVRVREDLVRLFVVSVLLDSESIVDQLIRMSAAPAGVDRERLRRDVERILIHYYGLPLKYIRAREVINDILPIMYRHHLALPPDLWLLGKTLMMWEGLAYTLYPDFDFFAVADPYVRRFLKQLRSPKVLVRRVGTLATQWGTLFLETPQHIRPLLTALERGQWTLQVRQQMERSYQAHLDRMTKRLAISILLAALVIGLGGLIPALDLRWPWPLSTWLILPGFLVTFVLSLWWLWSVLR